MKFFIIATRFLSAVASTSPNALRVRQDGPTAEVKDFTVDKLVRATDIEGEVSTTYTGISFIVDGPDASGVICETDNLHTFPTDILPCNNPKYHYVLSGGNQGSGIEFRIQVHFGDGSRLGIDGRRDVPTECFANEANREQFVCRQLIPVVIALGR